MTHTIIRNKGWQWLFMVVLLGVFTLPTQAAVPDTIDYQGYLTDSIGSPINGTVFISFSLYNIDTGGIALWSDIRLVPVTNGLFNVKLGGAGSPFPLGLFDAPLWLGIEVAVDGEMTPRIAFSSAAFAHKADDALTLEGQSASSLDQSAHVADTSNPHSVTVTQIGAVSSTEFTLHTGDASAHHSKTISFTDLTDLASDAQLPATIARDAEIMPTVLAGDGAGSTLDADLLDGLDSTAFMSAGADNWVNITGDTMTGVLNLPLNGLIAGTDQLVLADGDVGIGTTSPTEKLTVAGTIESTSGGMKFPDGSLQTTAASGSLYGKVAVVAQSGGDYTSPLAAMTDLANWCGTPSATNPCLLRIMPGIYDLGNNGLTMQAYVDIEGSGEHTTTITSTHSSGTADANSATVIGADHAEIRFLTVENRGGSTYAFAIYNNEASPKITHVTATASTTGFETWSSGVYNANSSPTMTHVTALASGAFGAYGVSNNSSSPTMINVTATAALSGGSEQEFTFGVSNNSSSPTMINVIATASGGIYENRGVYNIFSSSPTMTNVTATASGGANSYGVDNSSSSPTMTNVTAIASGTLSTSYGVYNSNSSPTLTNVTVTSSHLGMYNRSTSSPTIKNSSISGLESINNSGGSTTKVGATMLDGPVSGTGFTCVGAYDENFVALSTGCL